MIIFTIDILKPSNDLNTCIFIALKIAIPIFCMTGIETDKIKIFII